MTSILDLPRTVRQDIFTIALLDHATPSINLLPSCRQVYDEARPILYKRPLVCKSQDHMWQRLNTIDPQALELFESLVLNITDIVNLDCAPFNGHNAYHTPPPSSSPPPTWESYQAAADLIHEACRMLPNVLNYAIQYNFNIQTQLQQDFIQLVLSRTPRQWPKLQQISFDGNTYSLNFLKAMPELSRVCASGFSTSTPMETTAILSRLRHLKDLQLDWSDSMLEIDGYGRPGSVSSMQSITRDTIKGFRGLQSLRITESKTSPTEEAVYMTSGFIQALDSSHRLTMRSFQVDLDFAPALDAQLSLHTFLGPSFLKYIDLVWPGFNEQVLDFLPETLISLRIPPCPPRLEPYCLLELSINKCRLPAFCHISVARSKDLDSDAIFSTFQFQSAVVELERCGVRVHLEAPP